MITINKDIIYYLWYENLKKINNDIKESILNDYKISVKEFYNLNMKNYIELGFDIKAADYIDKSKSFEYYYDIIKYTEKNNIDIVCFDDEYYPVHLKEIKNFPIIFFKQGNLPLLVLLGQEKLQSMEKQ